MFSVLYIDIKALYCRLSISLAQDDPIPGFSTRLNIGFSTTARFTSSSFGSSTSASISFAKSLFGVGVPTSPCRPASSHFSATTFTSTRSLDALTSTDNLDDFVAVTVQPDYDFLSECDSAVEKIVHLLQNNVNESLRPRRVIKVRYFCSACSFFTCLRNQIFQLKDVYTRAGSEKLYF